MKQKYPITLFLLLALSTWLNAQIVSIPDVNFRNAVIQNGADSNGNGQIEVQEAETVTSLDLTEKNISSLQGIEAFKALTTLNFSYNNLTSVDLTHNKELLYLNCEVNHLTALDVSLNIKLITLSCYDNLLTSLDVSNNLNLENLTSASNKINNLDLTNNLKLKLLDCYQNQLSNLDVSKNTFLTDLYFADNSLTTIDLSNNPGLSSLDCSSNDLTTLDLRQNSNNFYTLRCTDNKLSDIKFKYPFSVYDFNCSINKLSTGFDINITGYFECASNLFTTIDVSKMKLEYLDCTSNPYLTLICVSNAQLNSGFIYKDPIAEIKVCNRPQGEVVVPDNNFFKALVKNGVDKNNNGMIEQTEALATTSLYLVKEVEDNSGDFPVTVYDGLDIADMTGIEAFTNLKWLVMTKNKVVTLNLSTLTKLSVLNCEGNKITSLNISNNPLLTELRCDNNPIGTLDVSKQTALYTLTCEGNGLSSLDLSHNPQLRVLYCSLNNLSTLDVTNLVYLNTLYFRNNNITKIDLSKNSSLAYIYCNQNGLTSLNIDKCTGLVYLSATDNKITSLNLQRNTKLGSLFINYNKLSFLDVSKSTGLSYFDCSGNSALFTVCANQDQVNKYKAHYYYYNWYTTPPIKIEVCAPVVFSLPDSNLRNALLARGFDVNSNGVIELNELADIDTLIIPNQNIERLNGIEFFPNLVYLDCSGNKLDTLNVRKNFRLAYLNCSYNAISNLQLALSSKLIYLLCNNNNLASLNLGFSDGLHNVYCGDNILTTLNTSENPLLRRLSFHHNQLTQINLGQNLNLEYVSGAYNKLIRLDANKNLKLKALYCNNNELTELAINLAANLETLDCRVNYLNEICIHANHVSRTDSWRKSNYATWSNCDLRGLYFDGADDRASVPYNSAYNIGTGDFTIEFWINVPSYSSGYGSIISNQRSYNDGLVFMLYNAGKQLHLQLNESSYFSNVLTSLNDNNCHHIAVVRSGSNITFYLDGTSQGTAVSTKSINTTVPFLIGYGSNPFKGYLNEIRLWNIGRTSGQISNDRWAVLNNQPNLIGYWKLKEADGQIITDHSFVANNGTLGLNPLVQDASDPSRQSHECFSNDRIESSSFENSETAGHNEGFNFGPNPFTSAINLSFNSDATGAYLTLKVFNSSGILEEECLIEGKKEITLGENLNPGIYFIKISGNGDEKVIKVVKI